MLITPADLSYIAGFTDGEGCISICRLANKNAPGGFQYSSEVGISNSDKSVIEWIGSVLPGSVGPHCVSDRIGKNRREMWRYRRTGIKAQEFCELLLPYLKIKGPQARVLIEFQKTVRHGGKHNLTKYVVEHRRRLRSDIRILNRRGAPERYAENYPELESL